MYKCKYGDKVFYASDIIKGNGFTVCNIGFGNTLDFYDDDKVKLTYTSFSSPQNVYKIETLFDLLRYSKLQSRNGMLLAVWWESVALTIEQHLKLKRDFKNRFGNDLYYRSNNLFVPFISVEDLDIIIGIFDYDTQEILVQDKLYNICMSDSEYDIHNEWLLQKVIKSKTA